MGTWDLIHAEDDIIKKFGDTTKLTITVNTHAAMQLIVDIKNWKVKQVDLICFWILNWPLLN